MRSDPFDEGVSYSESDGGSDWELEMETETDWEEDLEVAERMLSPGLPPTPIQHLPPATQSTQSTHTIDRDILLSPPPTDWDWDWDWINSTLSARTDGFVACNYASSSSSGSWIGPTSVLDPAPRTWAGTPPPQYDAPPIALFAACLTTLSYPLPDSQPQYLTDHSPSRPVSPLARSVSPLPPRCASPNPDDWWAHYDYEHDTDSHVDDRWAGMYAYAEPRVRWGGNNRGRGVHYYEDGCVRQIDKKQKQKQKPKRKRSKDDKVPLKAKVYTKNVPFTIRVCRPRPDTDRVFHCAVPLHLPLPGPSSRPSPPLPASPPPPPPPRDSFFVREVRTWKPARSTGCGRG